MLDRAITELESDTLAALVQKLRVGGSRQVPNESLPEFIAHLEVRTRHLRATFGKTVEKLWWMTAARLQDPELLKAIFRRRYEREPETIVACAQDQLKSVGLPRDLGKSLAQTAMDSLPNADEKFFAPFWATLLPILEKVLRPKLLEVTKNAHLNALRRSIAPAIRAQQYRGLRFAVIDIPSNDLVIGDSAVVFHVGGARPFKPFLDQDDILLTLYLPLSSNRVLLAGRSDSAMSGSALRMHIVECAHEFFVSAESSDANARLAKNIGNAALPLTDHDLRQIVEQVVGEQLT